MKNVTKSGDWSTGEVFRWPHSIRKTTLLKQYCERLKGRRATQKGGEKREDISIETEVVK